MRNAREKYFVILAFIFMSTFSLFSMGLYFYINYYLQGGCSYMNGEWAELKDEINTIKNKKHQTRRDMENPPIFFITPSAYRPGQKADLIRLGQTIANVPNLIWIIVEDSSKPSEFIDDLIDRLRLRAVHLTSKTPPEWKLKYNDPHWKFPKGVAQRNAALRWIRYILEGKYFSHENNGIVYFGDDDNTYDWRLFDEMRRIRRVGIWPVGTVGGLLAEYPLINSNSTVVGFNAEWKPKRFFPVDMAGFALNISILHYYNDVEFSYHTSRGYLESHFIQRLNLTWLDLEPLAKNCTKVYVWHTRTEKPQLKDQFRNFDSINLEHLNAIEKDAIL